MIVDEFVDDCESCKIIYSDDEERENDNDGLGFNETNVIQGYRDARVKKEYVKKIAKKYGVSTMQIADFLFERGELTNQQHSAYVRHATDYKNKEEYERYKAEVVKEKSKAEPKVETEAKTVTVPTTPAFIGDIVKDWLELNKAEYERVKDLIADAQKFIFRYEEALRWTE